VVGRGYRLAFSAAEAVPFAKAGGLGDIAGALPLRLQAMGHEVSVFLPLYRLVDRERFPLEEVLSGRLETFERASASGFTLRRLRKGAGPSFFFVDAPAYFDRPGLYTDPETGKGYPDDGERFLFFSLAVLESLALLGKPVDVLHANDFHTGLQPALLEQRYRHHDALSSTASVYSIHNLAYQGIYPESLLPLTGLSERELQPGSPFEFWGRLSFMKAGIELTDLVSTVSPTYAREICGDPEFGCGLEGVLAGRGEDLVGVLNGIDTEIWSPESDPLIDTNYSADDPFPGKEANKRALLREFGLAYHPERPVFGVVSRLVSQKGFDLFAPIMESLMRLPLQIVILGTGEKAIEAFFRNCAKRHPDRLALRLGFDDALAHRIEAGADFFLMPSRYEPCGLNQLYSLRYGTVPVVRFTGGLADTVTDVTLAGEAGNGIGFMDYEPSALSDAIRRALDLYRDPESFRPLLKRIMAMDFSWESAARSYEQLYRAAILRRRGSAAEARDIMSELQETPFK